MCDKNDGEKALRLLRELTPTGSDFMDPQKCYDYASKRMSQLLHLSMKLAGNRNRIRLILEDIPIDSLTVVEKQILGILNDKTVWSNE